MEQKIKKQKQKSDWSLLWNPFIRIAGWQAFFLGLVIAVVTGIVGAYGSVVFDGVLDVHFVESLSIGASLTFIAIDLLSVVVLMSLAALVLSRSFRFVDILGTMTLARAPFLLLAIIALFVTHPPMDEILANPMALFSSSGFILYLLTSILIMVWVVALMYNGLKVSTGASGGKLVIVFVIALLLAEVLSKLLIYLLLH